MHSSHPDPKAQKRKMPAWFYDWKNARKFSIGRHGEIVARLRVSTEENVPASFGREEATP